MSVLTQLIKNQRKEHEAELEMIRGLKAMRTREIEKALRQFEVDMDALTARENALMACCDAGDVYRSWLKEVA